MRKYLYSNSLNALVHKYIASCKEEQFANVCLPRFQDASFAMKVLIGTADLTTTISSSLGGPQIVPIVMGVVVTVFAFVDGYLREAITQKSIELHNIDDFLDSTTEKILNQYRMFDKNFPETRVSLVRKLRDDPLYSDIFKEYDSKEKFMQVTNTCSACCIETKNFNTYFKKRLEIEKKIAIRNEPTHEVIFARAGSSDPSSPASDRKNAQASMNNERVDSGSGLSNASAAATTITTFVNTPGKSPERKSDTATSSPVPVVTTTNKPSAEAEKK